MASSILAVKHEYEQLERLVEQALNSTQALRNLRQQGYRKVADVAVAMTPQWHIFWLLVRERQRAKEESRLIRKALKQPPMPAAEIDAMIAAGELVADSDLRRVYGSAQLTDEQEQNATKNGTLDGASKRDKYRRFRSLHTQYVEKGGVIKNRKEADEFKGAWIAIMQEVFSSVDVIFATCNNCGSELLESGFNPDYICLDEAGQLSLSALCVPLTTFPTARGAGLFGDPKQLPPIDVAGSRSEFTQMAEISVLGLLETKGWKMSWLRKQYRMAESIAQFSRRFFYNNEFADAVIVRGNEVEQARSRNVAHRSYTGHEADEYLVVEQQSTSPHNHTNVDAVVDWVDNLLQEGVLAEDILVLSYYKAQTRLHVEKLRALSIKRMGYDCHPLRHCGLGPR